MNKIRFTQANAVIEKAVVDLLSGVPLPAPGDERFEELARAVNRVAQGDEQRYIGKVLVLHLGKHLLRVLEDHSQGQS